MAATFELVADFGNREHQALECSRWLEYRLDPIQIDQHLIEFEAPKKYDMGEPPSVRFQVSVITNIGESCGRIPLETDQLSRLGMHLYDVLHGAPHFELALVGWNAFLILDLDVLNDEWSALQGGRLNGLVVSMPLITELPSCSEFVPFDDLHVWIPYRGTSASIGW